jgi:hypothetical protein
VAGKENFSAQAIVYAWQAIAPNNTAITNLCQTLFFLAAKNP